MYGAEYSTNAKQWYVASLAVVSRHGKPLYIFRAPTPASSMPQNSPSLPHPSSGAAAADSDLLDALDEAFAEAESDALMLEFLMYASMDFVDEKMRRYASEAIATMRASNANSAGGKATVGSATRAADSGALGASHSKALQSLLSMGGYTTWGYMMGSRTLILAVIKGSNPPTARVNALLSDVSEAVSVAQCNPFEPVDGDLSVSARFVGQVQSLIREHLPG